MDEQQCRVTVYYRDGHTDTDAVTVSNELARELEDMPFETDLITLVEAVTPGGCAGEGRRD